MLANHTVDLHPQILLPDLVSHLPEGRGASFPPLLITGITLDSRRVRPGDLFVALTGGSTDAHRFIPPAVQKGAAAVVGTQRLEGLPVPYLQVSDSRRALADLSAAFYGFPARRLTVIGVTGTDGKTTTSTLIYSILQAAGLGAGMISTVNAYIGAETLDTGFHVTTPEAPDIQRYLAQMVARGLTHVVLESTSHGLAQQRVAACDFDLGVVTNITHEHLDYHGTYEAYREAKARLFTSLSETPVKPHGNLRIAVLNRDDASYEYLSSLIHSINAGLLNSTPGAPSAPVHIISYGLHPAADVRAEEVLYSETGTSFQVAGRNFRFPVESPLVGGFNLTNLLAAAAAAVGMNIEAAAVQAGVRAVESIPGRMENIDLGQDFMAVVDFAHTPNALRRALQALRQMAAGRVIAVFGSAGLRDRAKRRMMAETAAELADLTILTAEDPRTESVDEILAEMAAGSQGRGGVEGKSFWRVTDRGEAIALAVSLAREGDVVTAFGKGHEQSMCFGETEYAWDDRTAMRAALALRLGLPGPQMPYLPTQEKH